MKSIAASLLIAFASMAHGIDAVLTDDISMPAVPDGKMPNGKSGRLRISATDVAYLKFDMASVLPAGISAERVEKATLILWVSATDIPDGYITVLQVRSPWSEEKYTFAIPNVGLKSWRDARPLTGLSVKTQGAKAGKFLPIDLTEMVKVWVSDSEANYGVVLRGTSILEGKQDSVSPFKGTFDSKENTGTGRAPRLQIVLSGN